MPLFKPPPKGGGILDYDLNWFSPIISMLYSIKTMKLRKLYDYTISLTITIILLEIICWIAFKTLANESFSYDVLEQKRLKRIATIQEKVHHTTQMSPLLYDFHPYLGYSGNPKAHPWGEDNPPFNQYGMLSIAGHRYPYKKQTNEFVIAVLGGSVAEIFANLGEQSLNHHIRNNLRDFNQQIVLISLATGGYKQPQQIFHLQYALLSGFEFDAVLNIDGFNEIVSIPKNIDNNINPLFPSSQEMGIMSKTYMRNQLDLPTIRNLYMYYALHFRERALLTFINQKPFKYSIFLNLVGELWTSYTINKINQVKRQLEKEVQQTLSKEFRGPTVQHPVNKYELASKIWRQGSKMLYDICKANHLIYLHFLQPNQYVIGSKSLSENEKKRAFLPHSELAIAVQKGYPYLIATGVELKRQNIPFYDLTHIFQNIEEDIYSDTCCHFGIKGNDIIAEQIAKRLVKFFQ